MKIFKDYPVFWLILFVVMELGFHTWWHKQWGEYANPTVLLLAGLMICWIAYRLVVVKNQPIPISTQDSSNLYRKLLVFGIFAAGVIFVGIEYHEIQLKYPVSEDGTNSDVIPSLILYVRRFLSGEYPYQPLEFAGWTVLPTYFPMMWLPYCFSEIMEIDYRWTAYLVFLIPLFIYQYRLTRQDLSLAELGVKAAFPFLVLYVFMSYIDHSFGYGVELMPIGLYFFLTLVLDKKSPWLIAIPIVFVLLSRYAFTFWLPVFLLTIWIEKGFFKVFKISLWVLAGVLMLYVIPFLSKDWEVLTNGLKYYATTAESVWVPAPWQDASEKPTLMTNGMSHAIYFYDFVEGVPKEKLGVNRLFHLSVCLIAALLLFLGYWKNRKKGLNIPLYFLIGLKFYILIFYSFFYVPFRYLYQLPVLLTIPILYHIPLFSKEYWGSRSEDL